MLQSLRKGAFPWKPIAVLGSTIVADALRFNLDVETNDAVQELNKFFQAFDEGAAKAQKTLANGLGQKIETEVVIGVKNGKAAAGKIFKIGSAIEKSRKAAKALNGEFGDTPAKVNRAITVLKSLRDNTRKVSKATGEVSDDWKLVTRRIEEATAKAREFSGAMPKGSAAGGGPTSGVAGMGAAFTAAGIKARLASEAIIASVQAIQTAIRGIVDRSRELGKLSVALQSFTTDAAQAERIMELAQTTGLAYGVSIQSVENAWRRVGPAASAAGLTLGETNDVITAATARMAQMGLSAEQSKRYMEALAQVMGKGKLQGEELRQQFAELDGSLRTQVAAYLNAAYGISSLDDAMQSGDVSAQMFAEALVAVSEDAVQGMITNLGNLNDQFEQLNLEQRFTNLQNIFTIAAQEWGDVFGPFGESLMRIGTMVGGFIATFTERFPNLAEDMKNSWTRFGQTLEMTVYGIIILIDLLAQGMEFLSSKGVKLGDTILKNMVPALYALDAMGIDLGKMWDESLLNAQEYTGEIGRMEKIFKKKLSEQQEALRQEQAGTEESRQQSAELRAQQDLITDLTKKEEDAKEAAKAKKKIYQEQKKEVKIMADSLKARYDEEIAAVQIILDKKKEQMDKEKEAYSAIKDEINERYDKEKSRITEIYDKKLAVLDLERDKLEARTPSEQKLYELEKKKLEEKIASGELDQEELLRAQARLERMGRQEQLEKNSVARKEVQKKKDEELKKLEKEKKEELEEAEKKHKNILQSLKDQVKQQKDKIKELKDQKREITDIQKGTKAYTGDIQEGIAALQSQVTELGIMEGQWKSLADDAERYAAALKDAEKTKSRLDSETATGASLDGAAATGGPVFGGGTYQVNELGQEAFLSAAGKLSMINAPAFGHWKAPSSGTVIPAHLTKQLDIPTGGININKSAGASIGRSLGASVRVAQAAAGDTFHQNVTVQAANPVQAANNMMVEMTRFRRRRFG